MESQFYTIEDGLIFEANDPVGASEFDALAGRYDPSDQPPVVTWDSFKPEVERRIESWDKIRAAGWSTNWWDIAKKNAVPIWVSNQGQLGSCAGWSEANGYMTSVLLQMMTGAFQFAEINPLATWARTKNWSLNGGQSMSRILIGGNEYGNYPVALIGEYNTKLPPLQRQKIIEVSESAKEFQIGACRLPNSDLPKQVTQCCRAGFVVCIGNSVKVSGSRTDQNGVRIATLGGSWSHATLFDGYQIIGNTVYLHWTNSHGNQYTQADRFCSPQSGCWMPLSTVQSFCNGRYVDAFCIVRAEAPIDTERKDFNPATFFYQD